MFHLSEALERVPRPHHTVLRTATLFDANKQLTNNLYIKIQSDEEEPVCMKPTLEKQCESHCVDFQAKLDACAERIEGKGEGYDCRGQAMTYFGVSITVQARRYLTI